MIKTLTMVLNEETNTIDIKVCVSLLIENEGICHILSFPYNEKVYKENETIFHVPLKLIEEKFDRISSIYKNKILTSQEKEERIKIVKMFFKKRLKEDKEKFISYLAMTPAEKLIESKNMGMVFKFDDTKSKIDYLNTIGVSDIHKIYKEKFVKRAFNKIKSECSDLVMGYNYNVETDIWEIWYETEDFKHLNRYFEELLKTIFKIEVPNVYLDLINKKVIYSNISFYPVK